MDFPGPRSFLTALLNHRSPGVSPGTWESRGMSPTGYPGYPAPVPQRIEPRRAGGRPSAMERVGSTYRARRSEELTKAREVFQSPLQFDLARGVRLERADLSEDESAQRVRIRGNRDVRGIHATFDQAFHLLTREGEVILRSVLQFNQDGLPEA